MQNGLRFCESTWGPNKMNQYFFIGYAVGVLTGYVAFAPETRFKKNFVDGLTLRFLWRRR